MTCEAAYHTITRCRSCGSEELTPLFSLGEQRVSDFVARDRVHAGPRVPIDIVLCRSCTLVQQKHTAPQDFLYTRHYWYRSGVTQTMRDALADVARAAGERVKLKPGDVVLDIGSNDGTLLRSYTAEGIVRVGVEPATNLRDEGSRGIDCLIPEFWSADAYFDAQHTRPECLMVSNRVIPAEPKRKAKIVTALGMFYDLENPSAFIADVARVLHPEGIFIAQLMCLKQTLEQRDVGNFAHEHLEFYSLESLSRLLGRNGLEIFDVEENIINGGSYRLYVQHNPRRSDRTAHETDESTKRIPIAFEREAAMGLDRPATYADFFRELEANKARCVDFIRSEVAKGRTVWVYGASTKGNVILQYYGLGGTEAETGDCLITAAADRSPEKVGLYTVGTGIPIVSEEEFRKAAPNYALCLPYSFLPEFMEREAAWRANGGKFIVPLPEFRVV